MSASVRHVQAGILRELKALTEFQACSTAELLGREQLRPQLNQLRYSITIQESFEPLVELPATLLRFTPHAYSAVGAPYPAYHPFHMRRECVERLSVAATRLDELHPGYKLKVFDAYRPIAVQQYMVDWTFSKLAREQNLNEATLSDSARAQLSNQVFLLWAQPRRDPNCPPPHSTGAAIDLTIVDADGTELDLGGPIDCFPPVCLPNHYANSTDAREQQFHANRLLLREVMEFAGFERLPSEFWHFSFGDQWHHLLSSLKHENYQAVSEGFAKYGAVEYFPEH